MKRPHSSVADPSADRTTFHLRLWTDNSIRTESAPTVKQGLIIARSEGVDRVLVTCDDDNEGSFRAIERCGGVLESVVPGADGPRKRRYWIE